MASFFAGLLLFPESVAASLCRAAAWPTTTYSFESHGLSEDVNDLVPSPVPASDFEDHFDIAYHNLNAFNVSYSPGSPCNAHGDRALFTHSVVADDYSLTFSNFGGANRSITAFGLTVCDFASNISEPVSIVYDTGTDSGTLLVVPSGQPDHTANFVGVVVCSEAAFDSITLTLDDNMSGFQWFDEVIYSRDVRFRSMGLLPDPPHMVLGWPSEPGLMYHVRTSPDLKQWGLPINVQSQGQVTTFHDSNLAAARKFYSVTETGQH